MNPTKTLAITSQKGLSENGNSECRGLWNAEGWCSKVPFIILSLGWLGDKLIDLVWQRLYKLIFSFFASRELAHYLLSRLEAISADGPGLRVPAREHLPGMFACGSVLVQAAGSQCRVFPMLSNRGWGGRRNPWEKIQKWFSFIYDALQADLLLDRVQRQNCGTHKTLETHGSWKAQNSTY